jgi:two-component system sensor histidine kinase PilS (NtrC family)
VGELVRVFANDKRLGGARVELLASEPVEISADPNQLRQVVWNLLRNAAEASQTEDPISIEVAIERYRGDGNDAASGTDNGHRSFARMTVRDHGPGIPQEHISRVFEPFFSTKEGGTGLGLATVHRIIEEHRGTVEVNTPPDGGTAVTVRLPLG